MRTMFITAALLIAPAIHAADHPLPPPHNPCGPPPMVGIVVCGKVVPTGYYRPDPYDVWQVRATTTSGQWRLRVIYEDGRAYYAIDGSPFPNPFSANATWKP